MEIMKRKASRRFASCGRLLAVSAIAALAATSAEAQSLTVSEVGFALPESILHDTAADVYLVSNVNGSPLAADGNGFISRISPDGKVIDLKWIDGAADNVDLNAPKGMAISDGVLWVADIDVVRRFDAASGAYLGAVTIPGATFLNDIAPGPNGSVYVSDSGLNASFEPTGTDAVSIVNKDGEVVRLIASADLGKPNGIAARANGNVWVVTFGSGELYEVTSAGEKKGGLKLPKGRLDGVVELADGSLLVSSWEGAALYRGSIDAGFKPMVGGLMAPGDIGWDAKRARVLIPLLQDNAIRFEDIR